jgi:hypothetical protein
VEESFVVVAEEGNLLSLGEARQDARDVTYMATAIAIKQR